MRPAGGQGVAKTSIRRLLHKGSLMDKAVFAQQVRDALSHLYDHVYLQEHPLAGLLAPAAGYASRGRSLHRVLLETIEALRPAGDVPPRSAAWRPYRVLFLRYVEALDTEQISEQLALSPRQVRREHSRGVEMVTDLLWQRRSASEAPAGDDQTDNRPLLDAAVARLGTAPPESSTHVGETLAGAIAVVNRLAAARQVHFVMDIPNGLPLCRIDRVVLRQVFLSILTEILRWQPAGIVRVCAHDAGEHLEVNFGCLRLLEADSSHPAEDDHLAVVRHLLELQGGDLVEVPTTGQGPLVLSLRLPVRRAASVLIVDDDADMVRLFQRYLGGGTFDVLTATSGQEALRVAAERLPQAITLDVMMPVLDGWEVLQLLKNGPRTHAIPVVVCSVLRERELALSLGASEFVAKPVTQLALLAALAQCGVAAEAEEHRSPPADSASSRPLTGWLAV
jgi:CheY-like chemotaxis protein